MQNLPSFGDILKNAGFEQPSWLPPATPEDLEKRWAQSSYLGGPLVTDQGYKPIESTVEDLRAFRTDVADLDSRLDQFLFAGGSFSIAQPKLEELAKISGRTLESLEKQVDTLRTQTSELDSLEATRSILRQDAFEFDFQAKNAKDNAVRLADNLPEGMKTDENKEILTKLNLIRKLKFEEEALKTSDPKSDKLEGIGNEIKELEAFREGKKDKITALDEALKKKILELDKKVNAPENSVSNIIPEGKKDEFLRKATEAIMSKGLLEDYVSLEKGKTQTRVQIVRDANAPGTPPTMVSVLNNDANVPIVVATDDKGMLSVTGPKNWQRSTPDIEETVKSFEGVTVFTEPKPSGPPSVKVGDETELTVYAPDDGKVDLKKLNTTKGKYSVTAFGGSTIELPKDPSGINLKTDTRKGRPVVISLDSAYAADKGTSVTFEKPKPDSKETALSIQSQNSKIETYIKDDERVAVSPDVELELRSPKGNTITIPVIKDGQALFTDDALKERLQKANMELLKRDMDQARAKSGSSVSL